MQSNVAVLQRESECNITFYINCTFNFSFTKKPMTFLLITSEATNMMIWHHVYYSSSYCTMYITSFFWSLFVRMKCFSKLLLRHTQIPLGTWDAGTLTFLVQLFICLLLFQYIVELNLHFLSCWQICVRFVDTCSHHTLPVSLFEPSKPSV